MASDKQCIRNPPSVGIYPTLLHYLGTQRAGGGGGSLYNSPTQQPHWLPQCCVGVGQYSVLNPIGTCKRFKFITTAKVNCKQPQTIDQPLGR